MTEHSKVARVGVLASTEHRTGGRRRLTLSVIFVGGEPCDLEMFGDGSGRRWCRRCARLGAMCADGIHGERVA